MVLFLKFSNVQFGFHHNKAIKEYAKRGAIGRVVEFPNGFEVTNYIMRGRIVLRVVFVRLRY